MSELKLALTFARRELRGGLKGFRVFFLCLLLGAAAISGVETLSSAFLGSLRDQGQTILGGDVSVSVVHKPITASERKFLDARGTVSESATMRAMAYALREDGQLGERQLVELKAVDGRWPLFGAPVLMPEQKLSDAIACEDDHVCGAVAEQAFVDRLRIQRGDLFRLGNGTFRLMGVLTREPDRISTGFSAGPRLLVHTDSMAGTGLITPESLVNFTYRMKLNPDQTLEGFTNAADSVTPDPNWRVRDSSDAAPGIRRFVERVAMFLTLIGLTVLCVGGAGAGQAILAFLDRKRFDIAILKSLGGTGEFVFRIFVAQVMGVALLATLLGAAIGTAVPFIVVWYFGDSLPVPPEFGLYPSAIFLALAFGLLSALAFAVPPLGRSRGIRPASLLRDMVAPSEASKDADAVKSRRRDLIFTSATVAAIIALAMVTAPRPDFAAQFIGGGLAVIGLLSLTSWGLMRGLAAIPRPRSPLLRLALANLTRPGAATGGTITALGLGLTLLATVTLLGSSVKASFESELPGRFPSFFFVDIQKAEVDEFDKVVRSFSTQTEYQRSPMIRGRIVSLGGVSAGNARVADGARWALNGDRGITYSAEQPPGTEVTKGKWWASDYSGPTLISLDESIAMGAELDIGDKMTVNVLGREIEGTIHNLRKVNFQNGRQNFVLILSPGVIDKAPHAFLATVRVDPSQENAMYRAVTDKFHSVSTVQVRDSLTQLETFIEQISMGISAVSLLTIFAGLLVLAGAITAGTRARVYDATILKVQGATRSRIAAVHAIEFAVLGVVTGVIALVAGTAGAWAITTYILEIGFTFDFVAAIATVAGGAAAVLLFGLFGAVAALGTRPTAVLRSA